MSTHADVIREQLRHLGPLRGGAGEVALDAMEERERALVAERDAFKRARLDDVKLLEQRIEA